MRGAEKHDCRRCRRGGTESLTGIDVLAQPVTACLRAALECCFSVSDSELESEVLFQFVPLPNGRKFNISYPQPNPPTHTSQGRRSPLLSLRGRV